MKDVTNINKAKRRRKKKTRYTAEYQHMYNGIQRCTKCGFAMAPGEDKMHSSYHSSYEKFARNIVKETGEDIIYSYEDFKKYEKTAEELRVHIKNLDTKTIDMATQYEALIEISFLLEYNASIRFYDFNREHPDFPDFKVLLLNTPFFINKLMRDIPRNYIESKVRTLLANRKMRCVDALTDEYMVYVGVETTPVEEIAESQGLNLIDLSHLDVLIDEEDEDTLEDVLGVDLEEIDNVASSLKWMGQLVAEK